MAASSAEQDAGLIAAAIEGDNAAFEALVRGHVDAVYGHALRFFRDPQAAEDATQEVFIKVYRTLPTFDFRSSFSTWLFRVTRNTCLDMFRAGRHAAAPMDPVDLPAPASPDTSGGVIASVDLERACEALAPEDRDAFNAIALFGLGYAEAAEALGAPVGTIKSRVFRARRSLVTMLGLDANGGA
jgi:RNA polymerase sigma-70 factor, ECF subfamily